MKNYFEQKQREYSERLDKKTMEYQKKYGFELNPLEGHRTWNVEADAFKHAFMGADLTFDYSNLGSFVLGIFHESQTPNNPQGEWNMDSWNNNKGREIAKEIIREYGALQYPFSQKIKDIIAQKVMEKMQNGELITHPDDKRKYENLLNGNPTGYASQVEPFSRQQIGRMTLEKFTQNEALIMEQLRKGQIKDELGGYGDTENLEESIVPYTREDIAEMTTKEFATHEDAIMLQMKERGIPSNRDLPKGKQSEYSKENQALKNFQIATLPPTVNG